jgi:hypothetical protein
MDVVMVVGIELRPPEWLMVALLAPQLPLAYLVARAAVARARRGDVPEWRLPVVLRTAIGLRGARKPIPTAEAAQRWSEWRQHGWSLPGWVAIVLPFASALVFIDRQAPAFVLISVVTSLLTPPLMAAFVGVRLARAGQGRRDEYGLSPFLATRPLTSAALVAAKLRVALLSIVMAWVVAGAGITLTLTLADAWAVAGGLLRRGAALMGTSRPVTLSLLTVGLLIALTWKRLVVGMYVALTGRTWLVRTHLALNLVALALALPVFDWIIGRRDVLAGLQDAAPWILGGLVALKLAAAGWVMVRVDRARLVERRTLARGAAAWLLVATSLYVLLVWVGATSRVPGHLVLLTAILLVPLSRLCAAPLALAWNRHR